MPWKMVYEEAPKDEGLSLWQTEELPKDIQFKEYPLCGYQEAWLAEPFRYWYECRDCKGWIEGSPNTYPVNTLESYTLSGRQGTDYHCRRCGMQISFVGIMS